MPREETPDQIEGRHLDRLLAVEDDTLLTQLPVAPDGIGLEGDRVARFTGLGPSAPAALLFDAQRRRYVGIALPAGETWILRREEPEPAAAPRLFGPGGEPLR